MPLNELAATSNVSDDGSKARQSTGKMRVAIAAAVVKDLAKGWQAREIGPNDSPWLAVNTVPTYIHEVLLDHGK